jgi:hypothetical protein
VLIALAILGVAPRTAPAMSAAAETEVGSLGPLTRSVLQAYSAKGSASDPRYYADGEWFSTDNMQCWTCNASPGVAAGVLGLANGDQGLVAQSIATFDRAIAGHAQPDGSFYGADGKAMAGIDTGFFLRDLGTAHLRLAGSLPAATDARWTAAIAAGADYLIKAGHTTWYANGNINLMFTEDLYLAWRATGQQRFYDAYQASWDFTTSPPQGRWPGDGLHITKQPTQVDGSDGFAYLAESSGGPPGFDPAYTQVQADVASSLWVVTQDPRALRLMEMLLNTVMQRVDSTGTYDASGGSRKDLKEPFMTPALAIAVRDGGRSDLEPTLKMQVQRITAEYKGAMTYTHQNYYRGLSTWLSTTLMDFGFGGQLAAAPAAPITGAQTVATTTITPKAAVARPPAAPATGIPAAAVTLAPVESVLSAPVLRDGYIVASVKGSEARQLKVDVVSIPAASAPRHASALVAGPTTLKTKAASAVQLKIRIPAKIRKSVTAHRARLVLRVRVDYTSGAAAKTVQRPVALLKHR